MLQFGGKRDKFMHNHYADFELYSAGAARLRARERTFYYDRPELLDLWRARAQWEDPDSFHRTDGIRGDADVINDRFYRDLAFGTGGCEVIGAGSNRMNIYTIRRATKRPGGLHQRRRPSF